MDSSSHSSRHHNLAGEHAITDIGQLLLFVAFVLILVLDIFVFKFSLKIIGTLPYIIALPLFILFFIAGNYLIFTSHQLVFKKIEKDTEIVTSSVFKLVRHPMYFGSILLFFSFVILSYSLLAFLVWLVICLFYYFISRFEEKLLIDKFGNKYKKYQEEVPMFIPFLKK